MSRRWAAACGLSVLALAGCTSEVTTTFTVTSPTQASVTSGVSFTGEAADVLKADPKLLAQLTDVFSSRLGAQPKVAKSEHRIDVTAQVPYSRLKAVSDITGVTGAALAAGRDDRATLTVQVAGAPKIVEAIRAAAKSQPEPAAVTDTMLANTHLVTRVVFAGGSDDGAVRSKTGAATGRDGDAVTFTRPATASTPDAFTVTGDTSGSRWLYWVGGLTAAMAAGVLALRSRRR